MSNILDLARQLRQRATSVLRVVIGAPDYDRYVAHTRRCHPTVEPMSWDDFYRSRLEERFNKPGAKCC